MNDIPQYLPKVLSKNYSFPIKSTRISLIETGVENENYLVTSDTGKYVLRCYSIEHSNRGKRSKADIEIELNFMKQTRQANIPTPTITENNEQDTITVIDIDGQERYIVLLEFMDGELLVHHSDTVVQEVGTIVNKSFDISLSLHEPDHIISNDIITRSIQRYEAIRVTIHDIPNEVQNLYQQVVAEHVNIKTRKLSSGLIHGDIKLENLLFDTNNHITAVLDFDDFRYSYLLEEVTTAIMHNLHAVNENILRSGYYDTVLEQCTHPQLATELVYLPFFLKARFLYDVANYLELGLTDLVKELLTDDLIRGIILD